MPGIQATAYMASADLLTIPELRRSTSLPWHFADRAELSAELACGNLQTKWLVDSSNQGESVNLTDLSTRDSETVLEPSSDNPVSASQQSTCALVVITLKAQPWDRNHRPQPGRRKRPQH
eukprot:3093034-Amphidinium_carterae.1